MIARPWGSASVINSKVVERCEWLRIWKYLLGTRYRYLFGRILMKGTRVEYNLELNIVYVIYVNLLFKLFLKP